jgi:hypothetical protein
MQRIIIFRMEGSKHNSTAKMSDDSNEKLGPVLPLFVQVSRNYSIKSPIYIYFIKNTG